MKCLVRIRKRPKYADVLKNVFGNGEKILRIWESLLISHSKVDRKRNFENWCREHVQRWKSSKGFDFQVLVKNKT